ncbi:diguanylate cyclase [Shewanella yunxiaonensis]|uniref:diguanylate cyclase n=1 Tax=Shewanella yunxiaonensis TaxID=2829809 RepID=A0ABX7YSI0_9GAMM|nr:diguanylate cyclase [Shewanella yunxiaonensis]QUN05620.1 diguanylate cyclase [Shewanella yunxiaonensis]
MAHGIVPLMVNQPNTTRIDLKQYTLHLHTGPDRTLSQVMAMPDSAWQPATQQRLLSLGSDGDWYHFQLLQETTEYRNWLVEFDNPDIDELTLYHFIDGRLQQTLVMGDTKPFHERPILQNNFVYPFAMGNNQRHDFWLKIETQGTSYLPIILWAPDQMLQHVSNDYMVRGMQLGILGAIGLFALFMATTTGSFSYGYYAGYVLTMTLLVASINGTAFSHLWPQYPQLQNHIIAPLIPLVMAFNVLFTEKALQLKYYSLKLLRLSRWLTLLALLLVPVALVIPYRIALYLDLTAIAVISVLLLLMSVIQAFTGNKLARLYALSSFAKAFGVLISTFMYIGWLSIPMNPLTPVMLGLTTEVVFMAAVLAIRYNDERKSKMRIQHEALRQAERIREAKEEALLLEAKSNERLERMVQERTLELEFAMRELNDANHKLMEQSQLDALTGAHNRASFDKKLQAEGRISRRQQTPLAMLMLDIDKFKAINDTYGHLAGDQVLKAVADTLQTHLKRPGDLASRFGGEEFAVILPGTDEEGAKQLAERLCAAVAQLSIDWGNQVIDLTVSIGVSAEVINADSDTTLLLSHADEALYVAKHQGRNQVSVYSNQANTSIANSQ